MNRIRKLSVYFLLFCILGLNITSSNLAFGIAKYPSYDNLFLNEDKYETFNRKMFNLNLKLNRVFVKKIHTIWASIFPNFVIDGFNYMYSNIEYPKRLISSLLQKDFDAAKHETKRFLINTTLGVGGFIDMADKFFKLELYNEDFEQALAKCKMKCGNYLVLPFISSTSSRDIAGRILDFAFNPTTYIASPVAAAIKMGLLINRTTAIQPMVKMVESNFKDSYDIAKKVYGVNKYIKYSNYDRKDVLDKIKSDYDEIDLVNNKNEEFLEVKGNIQKGENLFVDLSSDNELKADIFLNDYNPQNPITDSMRTALLDIKKDKKSIWNEISIWNRNFSKKIKTASVNLYKDRKDYSFRYVLQKDKTSPLAIIFPSVGEGMDNSHNDTLAKLFYDQGYSVILIGSHFQWEFFESLEKNYRPGNIKDDAKQLNLLVNNIISYLSKKYDRVFLNRTAFGTSLGAFSVLFLANEQFETSANNIDKFIAVCPPFELFFAITKMDEIISCWQNYPNDFKDKVAQISAKVMRLYKEKDKIDKTSFSMPFNNYESKLISAFVFHQKLSDLIYAIEKDKNPSIDNKELYNLIYSSDFNDYINRYLLVNHTKEELEGLNSLRAISNYLISKDNYKIYHSLDDYLINKNQLKELKGYCDNKLTLFNNGAHLGFLYRDEFLNDLIQEIKLKK